MQQRSGGETGTGPAADPARRGRRAAGGLQLAHRSSRLRCPSASRSASVCTDAQLHDDAPGGLAADGDVEENFGLGHF